MVDEPRRLNRRQLLKRGAIVGVVWATPAVQAVSMIRSAAAATSGTGCPGFAVEGFFTCPSPGHWGFRFTVSGHTTCADCTRFDGTLYVDGTKVLGFANIIPGVDPWTTPGDAYPPFGGSPVTLPAAPVVVRFELLCRPSTSPDDPVGVAIWEGVLTPDTCP